MDRPICFSDVISLKNLDDMSKKRLKITQNLFHSNEQDFDQLKKEIQEFLAMNDENSDVFTGIFAWFLYVRPKKTEFLSHILQNLQINSPLSFSQIISYSKRNIRRIEYKYLLNFIQSTGLDETLHLDNNNKQINQLFYSDPFLSSIIEDDCNNFQKLVSDSPYFDYLQLINVQNTVIESVEDEKRVDLLEFAAFFGSIKCFKFLFLNEYSFHHKIKYYAVAGGNMEIFNIVTNKGIIFDDCIDTSIAFHQYQLSDIILMKYPNCTAPFLTYCLDTYNETAFLYFYYNIDKYQNQDIMSQSLSFVIRGFNVPFQTIKLIIDKTQDLSNSNYLLNACKSINLNYQIIKLLIAVGIDVNQAGKDGKTPLVILCENEFVELQFVKILVEYGANINIGSPLQAILQNKNPNLDIIKYLIENGANYKECHLLYYACSNTNMKTSIIEYLITKGISVNEKCENKSALYAQCSISCCNIDIVRLLLKFGAQITDKYKGFSLLHYACSQENPSIDLIKLLLEKGADPLEICNTFTPLFLICINPKATVQMVNIFLRNGANVNQVINTRTVLKLMALQDDVNPKIFEFLLQNGADPSLNNPLYYLCKENASKHVELIRLLFDFNVDITQITEYVTPFFALCYSSDPNVEVIKMFIEHKANLNQKFKYSKYNCIFKTTPFAAILENVKISSKDIYDLFLDNGAIVDDLIISTACNSPALNFNMIRSLVKHRVNLSLSLNSLCENRAINHHIMHYLIVKGIDINKGSITALYSACRNFNLPVDLIHLLVENGADVNKGNYTPLFALCKNDKSTIELIDYLLDNGADINKGLYSPLYCVCNTSPFRMDIFDHLLSKGADVNCGKGLPLCAICSNNDINYDAIEKLINHGAKVSSCPIKKDPIYFACKNCKLTPKILKLLLKQSKKENYQKSLDEPLNAATSCTPINVKNIKLLIKYGANINYCDSLYKICYSGNPTVDDIEWMIERGADINNPNALFAACSNPSPDLEIIKLLVYNGADVNGPGNNNNSNETPLEAYHRHSNLNKNIIQFLEENGAKTPNVQRSYKWNEIEFLPPES